MSGVAVELRDIGQPKVTDHDVLIRAMSAGICGTDLAIISGHLKVPLPLVLGHEFSGEVVKVGRNVKSVTIGQRVTSEINLTCGKCFFCINGIPTHCMERKAIGIDVDGAFAEYIAVPAKNVHVLPSSVSYEEGAFVEPLAAALQTFKMSQVKTGDSIAIIGDGRLGQLVAQAIRAKTPSTKLLMLGKHDSKLATAKKLATLDSTVNVTKEDPARFLMEMTEGLGADIVVEATGNPDALNLAMSLVRHRGTIAMKSTHGQRVSFDATQVAVRELTLQGSRCGPFDEAIRMLKEGKVKVRPLISARLPLIRAIEALEVAKRPENLKVVLVMPTRTDNQSIFENYTRV
jgi:alcohol dehydrogenase